MAKDKYHLIVKEALIKDGWEITHDPYRLAKWNPKWEIDLGGEKMIAAEQGTKKIVVEVKSFEAESFPYEFHRAIGQYLNYVPGLEVFDPDRMLFLAVPVEVYNFEFHRIGVRASIEKYGIHLVTYNPISITIENWLP